jgi:hypothetical protein
MTDPVARLTLAAQDATQGAFRTVNDKLRNLEQEVNRASRGIGSSFGTVRNVLAGFGVALSAQGFARWTTEALKSKNVTDEQRAALDAAGASVNRMNTVLQEQAVILATRLAPALERAMDGWRRFLAPTETEATTERMAELNKLIVATESRIDRLGNGNLNNLGRQREITAAIAQLAQYRSELDRVWETRKRQASEEPAPVAPGLEPFDLAAIGRQQIPVVRNFNRELDAMMAEQRAKRDDAAAREAEQQRERLSQQVAVVRQSLMSEVEVEAEAYAARSEILRRAQTDGLIERERFAELSVQLEQDTASRISEIRERAAREELDREFDAKQQKLAAASNLLGGLAAIASVGMEQSKRQFELHKKLSIAQAIVDTYGAVAYALHNPPGPPWSLVNAAAAGAFGFAQVRAIQSTSWNGGGGGGFSSGAGGLGGGGGAEGSLSTPTLQQFAAPRDPARSAPQVSITVMGNVIGEGGKRELGEYIVDLLRRQGEKDNYAKSWSSGGGL